MYRLAGKRVFIAGHRGMVGSAILRRLDGEDCILLTADRERLDLRDAQAVRSWMAEHRPQAIFAAAARVGGILANSEAPADFLRDNLLIAANVIDAAHRAGAEKLLFLGSSCIYPREADQPIREEALLTGPLEPTNEAYAVAKIAGVKLAQAYRRQHGSDFISAMPCNIYGPSDNFDLESAHVVAALIRKAHEAKANNGPLVVWGSGEPRRELLFVDDLADACVFLMKQYSDVKPINVGTGEDISISELVRLVCELVGYDGPVVHDRSKPDGVSAKRLDVTRLGELGWTAHTSLRDGLAATYLWFLDQGAGDTRSRESVPS
jgi:GDP-L-fucose synthase